MAHDWDRQTGRTTNQMVEAPPDSVFVWVNAHTGYPRDLAARLGRKDLRVVGPDWLNAGREGMTYRGSVVVDHAALYWLSDEQWETYQIIQHRSQP